MKSDKVRITRKIFVDARTGDIEDYYLFEKVLGKGGFATVWLVSSRLNPSLKRAVKIISKSRIQKSPYLRNQFEILSRLDHPSIIRIYETFEDQKNCYFVLDYCEGGDLFQYLYSHPYLSEKDLRTLFSQMASVTRYCHYNHVAHRDIKPQNFLLLKKQGLNLKLIDFGMAFFWKYDMKDQLKNIPKKAVGTVYYAAPEVLEKGSYDEQCDVWSLGVILYAMTTASFPFNGKDNKEIMEAVKSYKYDKQNKQLKRVSFYLRDLIDRMLRPVKQRISLAQIFKHQWMSYQKISREDLKLNFARIRNYKKYSKFKKIAISCISSQLSETEIVRLGEQFKKLDTNYDGYLQLDEFQRCLVIENPKISKEEIKAIVDSIDLDHDGKINYLEFISSCLENMLIFKKENMVNAFRILDKNNDGKVSAQELKNLLLKDDQNIQNREIQEIISACDKNHDGLLDYEQFLKALTER